MTLRLAPRLAPATGAIVLHAPVAVADPPVALKFGPSLHRDLAAVKLTLIFDACLLRLLSRRLSRIAPREVVKLPERVRGQDEVPNRERQEVDEHPYDIGPAVSRDDDENGR